MKGVDLIIKNKGYLTGDTFFDTFIGPKLEESDESNRRIMDRVRRVFQCANKIGEVVRRHRNALIGTPPSYNFGNTSNAQAQAIAKQLKALMKEWQRLNLSQDGFQSSPVNKAIDDCLTTGYGYLRLWSPLKYARSQNPFKQVAMHSPDPLSVEVKRDADGFSKQIRYAYYDEEGKRFFEVQEINAETDFTTIWTEDEKGDRVQHLDAVTGMEYDEITLNLGGRYTIHELRRQPLITDTIRRAQDAINYALTLVPSLNEYSGFLLHLILNGQPPGKWEKDEATGKDKFVPDAAVKMSPGSINYVQGIPLYKEESENPTGYTNPQVDTTQPAAIAHLFETYKLFSSVIYESVGQGHILNSDMQISGLSRQQQRSDFKIALLEDAATIELVLSDVYMAALLMLNRDRPQEYLAIDLNIDLKIHTGELLPEDRNTVRSDYLAGLLSRLTAIATQGHVEDPTTEVEMIESELKTYKDSLIPRATKDTSTNTESIKI